jgi:hypothetical protein
VALRFAAWPLSRQSSPEEPRSARLRSLCCDTPMLRSAIILLRGARLGALALPKIRWR